MYVSGPGDAPTSRGLADTYGEVTTMGQATGQPGDGGNEAIEAARQTALDPTLPGWAVDVVGLLLDGDEPTLVALERLLDAAPWLYSKGRDWLAA